MIRSDGRIADTNAEVSVWHPEESLPSVSAEAARYSRGFLPADPAAWFSGLGDHWLPLFHILSTNIAGFSYQKQFELPKNLKHISLLEVDGEKQIIGCDRESAISITEAFLPGHAGLAAEIVLQYVERRLVTSLMKAWSGTEPLRGYYLRPGKVSEADVVAAIGLSFEIEQESCCFWIGLGPRLLDKLDASWRKSLVQKKQEAGGDILSDEISTLSIEIAELGVPPAMLIDYVRSGTLIDLEVPVSRRVRVRANGRSWAEGNLCHFRKRFAVEITNLNPLVASFPEGTTKMRVELSQVDLDNVGLIEHAQNQAILLTDTPLDTHVSLIISGEHVASAVLGEIGGNFALRIAPK